MTSKKKVKAKVKPKKVSQFPKIYRFIPDKVKKSKKELRNLGLGFAFGVMLVLILLFSLDLLSNFREKNITDNKRTNLLSQVSYWQNVVEKQKGYRDGYFTLSVLEYQLEDFNKSGNYLKMVLSIDPNFGPALDFQKILNRGM